MEDKFKVGDRVALKDDFLGHAAGAQGRVLSILSVPTPWDANTLLLVRMDGGGFIDVYDSRLIPAGDRKVKPGDVIEITRPWRSGGLYNIGDSFVVKEVDEGYGVYVEYEGYSEPIRLFIAEEEYRLERGALTAEAERDEALLRQGEPVAYIRQEDFEFILADDKSEPYGTRLAPVFSRNDCRDSVPLYTSPQPPTQDVEALLRQALEALEVLHDKLLQMGERVESMGILKGYAAIIALRERLVKENSND